MSTLEILVYPHPHLKKQTQMIQTFDERILQDYDNMIETMKAHDGAGLAANQVGLSHRLFVMNAGESNGGVLCFANVEILEKEGDVLRDEGCLSFPGIYVTVKRALRVYVKACDQRGQPFEGWYDDYMAHVIQHETDHLDGIVFLDHFSALKREVLERRYKKANRRAL